MVAPKRKASIKAVSNQLNAGGVTMVYGIPRHISNNGLLSGRPRGNWNRDNREQQGRNGHQERSSEGLKAAAADDEDELWD